MPKRIDLTGQKFNELTVLSFDHANSCAYWLCACSCGKQVVVSAGNLRTGNTKSCGHLAVAQKTTHGMYGTPTYTSWKSMHARCSNQNSRTYKHYGGRGISVCARWQEFQNFLDDMGERPIGTSLDRIDGGLGYSKENCRWATRTQQARNMRSNRIISHDGKTATVAEWIEITGIGKSAMYNRLHNGWGDAKAIEVAYLKRSPSK